MKSKFCLIIIVLFFCISISHVSAENTNDTTCLEISDTCENLTLSEKELSTSQVIQEESEDNMLLSNNYSSIICGNLDKVYGNDTNFTFYFYDNSRNGCAVVLSGIDFNYNAYIHTTNPILGLEFNGTNTNDAYICKAISSLLLGEIESKSLELTGRKSNSSLNTIFTEILNGRNYTITTDNETLTIQLEDNENCSWLYNINQD